MVAFKRKGLDDTPNTTRANRNTIVSGFGLDTSSTHRNHKASRSFSVMAIIKKCLFDICGDCNFVNAESEQNVKDFLIKLGSSM